MKLSHWFRTLPALTIVAASIACGGAPERTFVNVGTAPPGGAFFVVGTALTEVLGAHSGDKNWQVTAEGTSGSQENIRRLTQGELDFALSNSAITYFAVRGGEGWDRQYPMQTVMTLAPNVALFITKADSGIKTIADLKGKRVVIGPAGAGFEYFVKPILEAHGVRYEDFTALNASQAASVDMLTDGSAAAIFIGGAIPTASITQAAATMDLYFVPFDEAARAKLSSDYLFFSPATIPANTYRGQIAEFAGLDVGSMHLIAADNQDEELVYQVTKTLWEQREQVTQKHPAGRAINPKNVTRDTGTPFHPGAIRFYREIGIWPR
ncbi:MAG: TAXI family TRAP transporter solute-binding subunit [Acidobacteria bacterium]|jgi:TRAP transporter TAXI family solute receptor|nr:TAXI family TRAP transporter solute-binding subunit [Acidobacteriota bacterium]